ncbi:MAG: anti-sigma factor antagonist [Nitrospirae bacterium]|nr:MAG: anti-sigma factor antagonist [Nitrospirota bacterium]
MFVSTRMNADIYVIALRGQLGHSAKLGLEVAILGAQEAHARHIILDFSDVTWVDSAGLGKLLLTYHHLNRKKVGISIVNPKPEVHEVLELVKLSQIVPIYLSIDDAVHAHARL